MSKGHLRIESYGTLDELNSYLGLLRDQDVLENNQEEIIRIQNVIFVMGSHLASDPETSKVKIPDLKDEEIFLLEQQIDTMDSELPAMKNFILPGGHPAVSHCHIARCVCRRAERLVVALSEDETVDAQILRYLNRLSDYLFVLSRWVAQKQNAEETPWKPEK